MPGKQYFFYTVNIYGENTTLFYVLKAKALLMFSTRSIYDFYRQKLYCVKRLKQEFAT